MTPQELIAKCQQQIDISGESAEVMLIMRGRWGKLDYRTIFGVRGEIVQESERGIGVIFSAQALKDAVLRELQKGGADNDKD